MQGGRLPEGLPGGAVGADGVAERDFTANEVGLPARHLNFNDGRDYQRSLSV